MRHACHHSRPPCAPLHIVHEVQCRHQIEVEVWPPRAEVYFRDERYVDPANTQVRFEAAVYNGASGRVAWQVLDLNGNPGVGTIDAGGLYKAPPKGSPPTDLPHGLTEMIVARAVDDPLRSAYAWVTLIGDGPLPAPVPRLEIAPKQTYLYYPDPSSHLSSPYSNNQFIDVSNKMQLFRASLRDSPAATINWRINGTIRQTASDPFFLLNLLTPALSFGSGPDGQVVRIEAELASVPAIRAEARVVLINYYWPGS